MLFTEAEIQGLRKLFEQPARFLADIDRLDGAVCGGLQDSTKTAVRGIGIKKIGSDTVVDAYRARRKGLGGGWIDAGNDQVVAEEIPGRSEEVAHSAPGRQRIAENLRDELDAKSLARGIVLQISE